MADERPHPDDERALDPRESWGQGPDASHPETATADAPLEERGADPALGVDDADEVDEPPLT